MRRCRDDFARRMRWCIGWAGRAGASNGAPRRRPTGKRTIGASAALVLVAVALLVAWLPGGATATGTPPSISTDQSDYTPGATVTLTGSGWQPGEAVHVEVNDASGGTWSYGTNVTAGEGGGFTTQFQISTSSVASYLVTATGPSSGTATTTFTDKSAELSQCSNGGVGKTPEPCRIDATFKNWVNGNQNGKK